jgi:hypothetical protein
MLIETMGLCKCLRYAFFDVCPQFSPKSTGRGGGHPFLSIVALSNAIFIHNKNMHTRNRMILLSLQQKRNILKLVKRDLLLASEELP